MADRMNRPIIFRDYAIASALAILMVVIVDCFTNSIDVNMYQWDMIYYIDMANNGIIGNPKLLAPFAYRFVLPVSLGMISRFFTIPLESVFVGAAYIGSISQLILVFALSRHFNLKLLHSLGIMTAIAFSLDHVKYLLFDVYHSDQFAFPLICISILAFIKGKKAIAFWVAALGLFIREFLILPLIVLFVEEIRLFLATKSKRTIMNLVMGIVCVSLIIMVPRLLIHVSDSWQYVDPIAKPETLANLRAPLSINRDINFVFWLVSYSLPFILMATPERLKAAWKALKNHHRLILAYTLSVFVLAMYGGTDLDRFLTYLFIPLIFLMSATMKQGVALVEIIFMLTAVAVFNKTFLILPYWDIETALDFWAGFNDRVNLATMIRSGHLLLWVCGSILVRSLVKRAQLKPS
jgi:hypothetical protein